MNERQVKLKYPEKTCLSAAPAITDPTHDWNLELTRAAAVRFSNLHEEWRLLGCYAVWFLKEPHGVTSQKTQFFIVTAVKTSNLT
jgi:hypothetical protein